MIFLPCLLCSCSSPSPVEFQSCHFCITPEELVLGDAPGFLGIFSVALRSGFTSLFCWQNYERKLLTWLTGWKLFSAAAFVICVLFLSVAQFVFGKFFAAGKCGSSEVTTKGSLFFGPDNYLVYCTFIALNTKYSHWYYCPNFDRDHLNCRKIIIISRSLSI